MEKMTAALNWVTAEAVSASYGAQEAYRSTTAAGRANIERVFCARWTSGIAVESCGDSGFRAAGPALADGPVQLSGAKTCLEAVCWHAEATLPTKKRKRGNSRGAPDDGADAIVLSDPMMSAAGAAPRRPDSTVRFADGRTYFGRGGGKQRGLDVHKEVEHFVTLAPARFDALHPAVDPLTKAVTMRLDALALVGIDGERGVHHLGWRAGTSIDILCLNKRGELAAVELKTGSNGCFTLPSRSHPTMKPPFQALAQSALNRARLQVLFGALLLEHSHNVHVAECFVIHAPVSDNDAVAFDLGPVAAYKERLREAIAAWRGPPAQDVLPYPYSVAAGTGPFGRTGWTAQNTRKY